MTKKRILVLGAALAVVAAGILLAATPAKPKTVIHVVTVQWTNEATPAQIKQAIQGVETMNFPGLKNVWTRPIRMQLPSGYKNIIVMEFESEQALKEYAGSEAQKRWYEVYVPIRAESRTHDITN